MRREKRRNFPIARAVPATAKRLALIFRVSPGDLVEPLPAPLALPKEEHVLNSQPGKIVNGIEPTKLYASIE